VNPRVALLDYGVGNLHSAAKALDRAGAEVLVVPTVAAAAGAAGLVVPGVGAYGRPLLGICVGMQLLFEASEEGPVSGGVGALGGKVRRLAGGVKIPHIGWNQVTPRPGSRLFAGLPDGTRFYFVHSYAPEPDGEGVAAVCDHGGRFAAAVEAGNLFGTQFHPEKSGHAGLKLLGNFVDVCR
jgi:glutamine amidotransferase